VHKDCAAQGLPCVDAVVRPWLSQQLLDALPSGALAQELRGILGVSGVFVSCLHPAIAGRILMLQVLAPLEQGMRRPVLQQSLYLSQALLS